MSPDEETEFQELQKLYRQFSRLAALPDSEWSNWASLFTRHTFNSQDHIFTAGDRITRLYFPVSGIGRYYYLQPSGKEFNKSFITPGGVYSSISSLLNETPSNVYAQALTPTICFSISYQSLKELAEHDKHWNRLVMRLLELLAIKKERREADFLLLDASERYQNFCREYESILDQVPNYHIASYLGITEVALSRIRKKLKLT